jgi:hypothetical protein
VSKARAFIWQWRIVALSPSSHHGAFLLLCNISSPQCNMKFVSIFECCSGEITCLDLLARAVSLVSRKAEPEDSSGSLEAPMGKGA